MEKILTNLKLHKIIFFVIFLGCIFLLTGRLYITKSAIGGDAVYYYSALRSLTIDHDLNFDAEYQYFHHSTSPFTGNKKIPVIPEKNPVTGKLPSIYPIGTAIFLYPSFLITHFLLRGDGYNIIYQFVAALTSLTYAFLGILLIYSLGKKLFNPEIAFLSALSIWLATPLIYYMTMEPLNSQPLSFFAVSFFIYLWFKIRNQQSIKGWVILGIVGGLMSIIRYQDGLFILIPFIDGLIQRVGLTRLIIFILSILITLIPQFWANNYLFGSILTTGYQNTGFPYLLKPWIFYSLFSLQRGLLVWSPVIIFALIGVYWFYKKSKIIAMLLAAAFLIQLYIVSSWTDPSQGDSFGNRILLNCNGIFALGLMQFLEITKKYQSKTLILFSAFILSNAILSALFVFRIIGQPY